MATPEEQQRQIAQGLVERARNARTVVERLQLEVQQRYAQRRAQLEAELRAELEAREGIVGDFMDDEELRPIWDAAVVGDPANGIAPTFDQQAQSDVIGQINTERVERGDPSIQNTVADAQQIAQQAAPYQQQIAESGFVETPEQVAVREEEEDFQRMSRASAAFQDQVVRPRKQREANVINAVEQAMEGGEQSIEAFTQQIETISDSALRDQTIQLAQQAGMEFARPISVLGGPDGDGTAFVEYPSSVGAFNSSEATQFREGTRNAAAQFAQAGVEGPAATADENGDIIEGATIPGMLKTKVTAPVSRNVPSRLIDVETPTIRGVRRIPGGTEVGTRTATIGSRIADAAKGVLDRPAGYVPVATDTTQGVRAATVGSRAADLARKIPGAGRAIDYASDAAPSVANFAKGTGSFASKIPGAGAVKFALKGASPIGGGLSGAGMTQDVTRELLGREATGGERLAGATAGAAAGFTPHGLAFQTGYDLTKLAGGDDLGRFVGEGVGEAVFGDGSQPAFSSVAQMEAESGREFTPEQRVNMSKNMGIPIDEPEDERPQTPDGVQGVSSFF